MGEWLGHSLTEHEIRVSNLPYAICQQCDYNGIGLTNR